MSGPSSFGPVASFLAGREREQAALREALDAARAGRGGLVLIGGAAGIGKTALAEALCAEAAAQGVMVLVGHCYDLGEVPPYGPWVEIFARAPRDDGLPALPTAVLPPEHTGAVLAGRDAIVRRIHAYLAALAATGPALLLLEDGHWADPASLDLLRVLGRDIDRLPLLLLVTYRSDEIAVEHPLALLLPALVREARADRLDLRPLDAAAIGALVAAHYILDTADRERLVGYLVRRSEGNALFVGELLRTLESAGGLRRPAGRWALGDLERVPIPPLLRQVIAGRLARLGDEDRRLLAVAAVLGQESPFDLWATVGGVEEGALLATAERAIAVRALEATDDGVRFAHALIREALYAGTLAPRRRLWHLNAAEALIAAPPPDPDAVAHHLRQAGDPRAADWLIRAGERAQQAYAWMTAAERYEAALALLKVQGAEAGRLIELMITLAQMRRFSDTRRSVVLMEEAARMADALGDAAQAASARFEAGHLRCIAEADPDGLAAMTEALPKLETLAPGDRSRLLALAILSVSHEERYHRGAVVQWTADAGRYAEAWNLAAPFRVRGAKNSARGLTGLASVHAAMGRPDEARRALAEARAIFQTTGQHIQVGGNLVRMQELVALPFEADRVAERRRLAAEAEAAMVRASEIATDVPARIHMIELLVLEGNWEEARAVAMVGRASNFVGFRHKSVSALARLAHWQGDHERAWAAVRELLVAGPTTDLEGTHFLSALSLLRVASALALYACDFATARAWLAAHDRWLAWSGAVMGRAEGALGWAAYDRATGTSAQARAHADRALAHASEPRQPLALLAARRLLGELDTADGQFTDAVAQLGAALALADACAAPYERALTLLALAELRAATGEHDTARAALGAARALLTPLAAQPALARVAALAARRGDAPALARPDGLSRREAEVLGLLAAGRSNGEIAAALCLSPATVQRHVANAYLKIGAHNRAGATAYALRHRLA